MSKSQVSLEATEVDAANQVTEVCLAVDRDEEDDEDLVEQFIFMTPAELDAVYARLKAYFEHGTWSTEAVER